VTKIAFHPDETKAALEFDEEYFEVRLKLSLNNHNLTNSMIRYCVRKETST